MLGENEKNKSVLPSVVRGVQVLFVMADGSGQYVPLTRMQAQLLYASLGIRYNEETGLFYHMTDKQLLDKADSILESSKKVGDAV